MSLLDELFGQILQSEESIKQRFEQLKEAHSQILDYQSKLKDADFEIQSLWGTVAVKNHKLVEREAELKWLTSRNEILTQQISESKERKAEITDKIIKLEENIGNERKQFIKETKHFAKSYEWSSNLESGYDEKLNEDKKTLMQRNLETLKVLESLETCHKRNKSLSEKADAVNRSITSLIFEKDEKEQALQIAKEKTASALAAKEYAITEPQKNTEFKRLSEELSKCQKRSEELCKRRRELLSELYVYQQECMKKESYLKAYTIQNASASCQKKLKMEDRKQDEGLKRQQLCENDKEHTGRVRLFKRTINNSNAFWKNT